MAFNLVPDNEEGVKPSFIIRRKDLDSVVDGLIRDMRVFGVKSKHGKFVYDRINNSGELRLDFDVTIMPPSRILLPAKEVLLQFELGTSKQPQPVFESEPFAIIGVHPYDLHAIELIDEAFMATNPDPHYIARRHNAFIIGVDNLNPSSRSFALDMGTHRAEKGFDLLLTDLGDEDYLITVGTEKGMALLKQYNHIRRASASEVARRNQLLKEAESRYKLHLAISRELIPQLLEDNYENPFWRTRSEACLNCGSCVMVCPTCFCYDVLDEVQLNLREGAKIRQWDGCVLVDFARVASGENFRHDKASRFRHRINRKGRYVQERYGKLGCVGCGRCSIACLAEIASPLEAFNALAEAEKKKPLTGIKLEIRDFEGLHIPQMAQLIRVQQLTPNEKLFDFRFIDGHQLGHQPGQFVEVHVMGIGEAPISIASSPSRGEVFQLGVRSLGNVTTAMHNLKEGAIVGIRGPFGRGFPIPSIEGKDVLMMAGGIGLFPMRSLIQYILDHRRLFGRVILLYGCRSAEARILKDELADWARDPNIELLETVDKACEGWNGHVGVITTLLPEVEMDVTNAVAVVVGPPVLYKVALNDLKKMGFKDEQIIVSLERRMKCGVGKCGHCQIEGIYVCQEGPVFTLSQLQKVKEAL